MAISCLQRSHNASRSEPDTTVTSTGEATAATDAAARQETGAGKVYAATISTELDREHGRGQGLESSAEAVVRSVASMLALFTAVLALMGGTHAALTPVSLTLVALAYGLLIISGLVATGVSILGHRLRSSGEISTVVLDAWLASWDQTDETAAGREIAGLQTALLKTMRHTNYRKRQLTVLAVGSEIAGLAVLVVSLVSLAVK